MLKILVFLLLVAAVLLFFALRRTPPRPPRDWRRGGDDGGPVLPASQIGLDGSRKTKSGAPSGDSRETESVSSDAGGGDGGGGLKWPACVSFLLAGTRHWPQR